MELLDRYLEAVRKHLPWKRQADILAELRANLEAQLEDREAGLGRPLTPGEQQDWLRELGSPLQVAARYQPQQSLIGPRLFPVYLAVMRTVMPWVIAIYAVIWTVQTMLRSTGVSHTPMAVDLFGLPWSIFLTAAVITAIFAVVEFLTLNFPERFPQLAARVDQWSPAELPPAPRPPLAAGKPRSFAAAVAEVFFGAFFLGWWLLVPHYPFLLFGPIAPALRGLPLVLAPAFHRFYWAVALLNAVQVLWRATDLARGHWQVRTYLNHAVMNLLGMVPVIMLFGVPNHAYISLQPGAANPFNGFQISQLNQLLLFSFSVVLAIQAVQLAVDLGRYGRQYLKQKAAAL